MEYQLCEECRCNLVELHHLIYRSQASYLSNIKINFKFLCPEHHRGNNGPHRNRKVDIKYKRELQEKLFNLFQDKEYWTEKQIRDKLECTNSESKKITKKLMIYKEGYKREELILRLMGNRMY